MFARLFVGIVIFWLCSLCLLVIDFAGDIDSAKKHSNILVLLVCVCLKETCICLLMVTSECNGQLCCLLAFYRSMVPCYQDYSSFSSESSVHKRSNCWTFLCHHWAIWAGGCSCSYSILSKGGVGHNIHETKSSHHKLWLWRSCFTIAVAFLGLILFAVMAKDTLTVLGTTNHTIKGKLIFSRYLKRPIHSYNN